MTAIILNLKKLSVRLNGDTPKRAIINAVGPKEVTAADIISDGDVEIFNPELHIATLDENATLVMEINLANGRGYTPADQNKTESTPIAVIPVDSIYTPARKVNFTVQNTRVGQITDYDRLILEIWTDGSISPEGKRFHRCEDHAGAFEALYRSHRQHGFRGNHGRKRKKIRRKKRSR